jgi:hypothetical protein
MGELYLFTGLKVTNLTLFESEAKIFALLVQKALWVSAIGLCWLCWRVCLWPWARSFRPVPRRARLATSLWSYLRCRWASLLSGSDLMVVVGTELFTGNFERGNLVFHPHGLAARGVDA